MLDTKPRVVVIYNRDFEGADADPENKAREDIEALCNVLYKIPKTVEKFAERYMASAEEVPR